MTVMADIYSYIENNNLDEFNADMLATGTGHKVNTVSTTLSILKRAGRMEKGSKPGYYVAAKHEEMTEEERKQLQERVELRKQEYLQNKLEQAKNFVPESASNKKAITIAVDDSVEVNMRREGGRTVYSFVLK